MIEIDILKDYDLFHQLDHHNKALVDMCGHHNFTMGEGKSYDNTKSDKRPLLTHLC